MENMKPLLPLNSKRTLRRKMPSGLDGYVCRLHTNYSDFAEWHYYSALNDLAARLGYKSAGTAWKANPIICGSTNPSDFGRYHRNCQKCKGWGILWLKAGIPNITKICPVCHGRKKA